MSILPPLKERNRIACAKYRAANPEKRKESQRKYRNSSREKIREYRKKYLQTPKGKYGSQMQTANHRGIPWEFTFESWWKVWEDSGKWEERGTGSSEYQMCRYSDIGPYSPENVYIGTCAENAAESNRRRDHTVL